MIYGYKNAKAFQESRDKALDTANNGIIMSLFIIGVAIGICAFKLLSCI